MKVISARKEDSTATECGNVYRPFAWIAGLPAKFISAR